MITVMGATGNTGRPIVEELTKQGEEVRALGRSLTSLAPLAALGAEPMAGEAGDAAYLERAFSGADAVYAMVPPNFAAADLRADQDRIGAAVTEALGKSGVRHVVLLSSLGADLPAGTGPIAGLHAFEERLKTIAGAHLLFLRAAYFFENHFATLGLIKQRGVNGGAIAPDVPMAMIATRDIAHVAAEALRRRDFRGVTVRELLGQRDLTMAETTRIIGEKIGKPTLRYVQIPAAEMEKGLVQMGLSPRVAASFSEMAQALSAGRVRSLEGRRPANTTPTSFEEFAAILAGAYHAA